MADPEPGEDTGTVAAAPDFSANALRREPATIEGTAQDVTPPDPAPEDQAESAAEAAEHASNYDVVGHVDELDRPPEVFGPEPAHDAPPGDGAAAVASDEPREAVSAPPDPAPRRGGILAPLLISLIVGAAAGFGGAYGWRYLDKSDAKLDALSQQISSLAQQQSAASGLADAQTDLASRLKAVEAVVQADETALAGLRSDVEKLAAHKVIAPGIATPDLGPLTQQVSAVQDKLAALTKQVGDLSSRVETQKTQVAATQHLVRQTAAAHADDTAAAIITGSLMRKVEAGLPFADDLSGLESRGIDKAQLAALTPAATTGVATPGALSKQFAAETDAILSTAPAPKAHGFFDRLVKDAEGLVHVRKIGDATGDSLAAHVARIQNALDAGSVETAYQQWTDLSEAAKSKSRGFGTAAKLRLDVIAAARAIETEALAGLGKAKP
jgi:hypothetical protein